MMSCHHTMQVAEGLAAAGYREPNFWHALEVASEGRLLSFSGPQLSRLVVALGAWWSSCKRAIAYADASLGCAFAQSRVCHPRPSLQMPAETKCSCGYKMACAGSHLPKQAKPHLLQAC
jgi:uncharacterized Zn-finger protein